MRRCYSSWELLSGLGAVAARRLTRYKTVLLFKEHLTETFPWRHSSVQSRSVCPHSMIPVSDCRSSAAIPVSLRNTTVHATTRMALRRPRAEGTIGFASVTEIESCSKTTPTRRRWYDGATNKQFGPGRILIRIHTHGPTKSLRVDRVDSFNLPF